MILFIFVIHTVEARSNSVPPFKLHVTMTEVEKHSTINNHETIEEVDEDQSLENTKEPSWQERIQKLAIQASSNLLGQFVIRQSDRLLWTVEKTANWSCPLEKGMDNRMFKSIDD